MKSLAIILLLAIAGNGFGARAQAQDKKKIVLVAGAPIAGPGEHEFNAGVLLLKKCLDQVPGIEAVAFTNGWPAATNAFEGAAAIVLYTSGGTNHPVLSGKRLAQLHDALKDGAGFACIHHATEVPGRAAGFDFQNWMGGYFETNWSVKGFWDATFTNLVEHPVTRGVKPFTLRDEWYYNMRFQDSGVTPLLSAVPPESTRGRDGPYSGNATVRARAGMAEEVAWAYERPDGGRGFGVTGGHYHKNWGDDNFRKLVLNALVWIAKGEVPLDGVQSSVTAEDLTQNLDAKASAEK